MTVVVWVERTILKTVQTKLNKRQRSEGFGVTAAIKTSPPLKALDFLYHSSPLNMIKKTKALKAIVKVIGSYF